MATEEELIAIRVAVREAQKANAELRKVARAIDEVGDEAEETDRKADQAARSITRLGSSSSKTRVSLGPFSTSLRGVTLVIGGVVLAAEKLTPAVLSAGEAVFSLVAGGGAAGGVGILALGQAGKVASLGLGDLTDALGGNEEAARSLSPEAYELYRTLSDARGALEETAEAAMLPGLQRGGLAAMRNFGRLNNIVHATGEELGRLSEDAGRRLGSAEWGGDLSQIGQSNVRIVGDLGDAGLHLAEALKDVVVEAGPLTEWLAGNIEQGAAAAEVWADGARKGGELRDFFQGAKGDLILFADATGNVVAGLSNLFGNQDVSGTRLLEDLDAITQRFEDWTNSPAVRNDFGEAIRAEIADGVAAAAGAAAETLPLAAGRAAEVFWDSFWSASPEAKALLAIVGGSKALGALRGSTPLTPMFVKEVAGGSSPTDWLKNLAKGGAGATALRAAAGGASVALPAGLITALVLNNNHDFPSGPGEGATRHGREDAGRPSRDNRGAFERVPDVGEAGQGREHPLNVPGPFEPIVHSHLKVQIGEETVARANDKATARRRARGR